MTHTLGWRFAVTLVTAASIALYTLSAPATREASAPDTSTSAIHLIAGHVILGFADGSEAQLLANADESISILSPLAFFITSASGQLTGSLAPAVVKAAHAHHIAVWPMVEAGFDPTRTTAILANNEVMQRLVKTIVHDVVRDHVDGINLDFEDMIPADAPRFTHLVALLHTSFIKLGKGLSVDITPPSSDPHWGLVYQRAALAKIVNYEVVMSYDEHYGGDPVAGSVASLPWTRASITAAIASGIPAAKILMGIPFYTRDWFHANGALQSTYIPLGQGMADQQIAGAKTVWNAHTRQDVVTFDASGVTHTIWLENETSLGERGILTKDLHVAGDAIWQLDLGDQTDVLSLLRGLA